VLPHQDVEPPQRGALGRGCVGRGYVSCWRWLLARERATRAQAKEVVGVCRWRASERRERKRKRFSLSVFGTHASRPLCSHCCWRRSLGSSISFWRSLRSRALLRAPSFARPPSLAR
jgi:hypothetical protein